MNVPVGLLLLAIFLILFVGQHEYKRLVALQQEELAPRQINGFYVREKEQVCPGCGADIDAWCQSDCPYLDIADYR